MKQRLFSPLFFLLLCGASIIGSIFISGCTILSKPHEKHAQALLLPTAGNTVRGRITFIEHADGTQVSYSIQGLRANRPYGFQIHQYGNCSASDAQSAGDVFALAQWLKKRVTNTDTHPEGKMPNVHADADGVATGFIVVSDLSLDGIRSVVNRSVVVLHIDSDSSSVADQRLACGVIQRQ